MNPTVLLVSDDDAHVATLEAAARSSPFVKDLVVLRGAPALFEYLDRYRADRSGRRMPGPNLILYDLAPPLNGARDVLAGLKSDDVFKPIPVVVLARGGADEDFGTTYDLGVNAFVRQPGDPEALARMVQAIEGFWLGVVTLPHAERPTLGH